MEGDLLYSESPELNGSHTYTTLSQGHLDWCLTQQLTTMVDKQISHPRVSVWPLVKWRHNECCTLLGGKPAAQQPTVQARD